MLSRSLTRLVVWLLLSVAFAQSLAVPHAHEWNAASAPAPTVAAVFQEATDAASEENHEGEVECRCQWCSPYLHAALAYDTRLFLPAAGQGTAPFPAAIAAPTGRKPWARQQPRGPPARRLG